MTCYVFCCDEAIDKLGFCDTGKEQTVDGLIFTPMKYAK